MNREKETSGIRSLRRIATNPEREGVVEKVVEILKSRYGNLEEMDKVAMTIAEFAEKLGDSKFLYLRVIAETGAIDILTSQKVMEFVSSPPFEYNAPGYFSAIGLTGEVGILTSQRVMDFARSLPESQNGGLFGAEEYFAAIVNTQDVSTLTSQRVIDFARSLPEATATIYFYAIAESGDVSFFTGAKEMEFLKKLQNSVQVERHLLTVAYTTNREFLIPGLKSIERGEEE